MGSKVTQRVELREHKQVQQDTGETKRTTKIIGMVTISRTNIVLNIKSTL